MKVTYVRFTEPVSLPVSGKKVEGLTVGQNGVASIRIEADPLYAAALVVRFNFSATVRYPPALIAYYHESDA